MKKVFVTIVLIFVCFFMVKAQQYLEKETKFNVRTNVGYSTYATSYKGMFMSIDYCLPILSKINLVNSFTMSYGKEEAIIFRSNYHFIGWGIGPELSIKLFRISQLEFKPAFATSWMMMSETLGQMFRDDGMAYPVVSDHSFYSIGYTVTLAYRVFIKKNISIGVLAGITSVSKKKKSLKTIGLSCQFDLN